MAGLFDRFRLRDSRRALAAVVVVALGVRLVGLGARVAHWDEGRVGYWILRTAASGHWEYRPIIHGPFVQHVTRWVIEVLGATDFAMRVPVALLGSLLPFSALLFRSRLRDEETIALGIVLAFNPLLLYYSRFMRSDLPVAVFAFVAFGALLRAIDTDRRRYLHLTAVAFAFALTAKENALLYPLSWLGALALLAVGGAIAGVRAETDWLVSYRSRVDTAIGRAWAWRRTLLVIPMEMFAVLVLFYAPRRSDPDAGLGAVLGDPTLLPGIAWEATAGSAVALANVWFTSEMHAHPYLPYLGHFLAVLAVAGLVTVVMASLGAVWARRPLVLFCGWWAVLGIIGYPYVADIKAPWLVVHVVIALAIPAAVGLADVLDRLREHRIDGNQVGTIALAGLLICSGAFVAGSAATTSQQPPHGLNIVAQGGQPGGDLRPIIRDLESISATTDGPHVLYYGDLAVPNESHNDRPPVPDPWFDRLPLPWYTAGIDATVVSVGANGPLPRDPPPVVIANSTYRADLETRLPGYSVREQAIQLRPGPRTIEAFGFEYHLGGQSYVFFVDRDAVKSRSPGDR